MGEVDIQSFLRELRAVMAGIEADQFLTILVAVVLGGFILYVLSFIFNQLIKLAIFVIIILAAYFIYNQADAVPLIFNLQQNLRSLWPDFPPLRIVLPTLLVVFAVAMLLRRIRDDA